VQKQTIRYTLRGKYWFLFALLLHTVHPLYSAMNSTVTDSMINQSIRDADFDKALSLISEYSQKGSPDKSVETMLSLKAADIFLIMGKLQNAEEAISQAAKSIAEMQNPSDELQFQYACQKGACLNLSGRYAEASTWLRRGENLLKHFRDIKPSDKSKLYGELGLYYKKMLDYESSLKYYELAISAQQDNLLKDSIQLAYYYACLADACWHNNETQQAEDLIALNIDFLRNVPEPSLPALLDLYLVTAAFCITINNDIDISEELLVHATQILDRYYPADHFKYSLLYFLKSEIEYLKMDFDSALMYCEHALSISNTNPSLVHHQTEIYTLISIINYFYKNDFQKAIDYCNKALASVKNSKESKTYFYYLLGVIYNQTNNRQIAVNFFKEATQKASEKNSAADFNISSMASFELAKISLKENKHEENIYYLKNALNLEQKVTTKGAFISSIYNELSRSFYLKGNLNLALHYIQNSIIASCNSFKDTSALSNPVLTDVRIIDALIESFSLKAYLLYMLYENSQSSLKYLEAAFNTQELAVKLTERLVININDQNAGLTLIDKRKLALNNAVSYASLLYLRTFNRQYAEKAFVYSEKSKMQLLLINTLIKNNLNKSDLPDSLIKKEDKLNKMILEIENRLALNEKSGRPAVNEILLAQLTDLYGSREELTNMLGNYYPDYYRAKYELNVAGLASIQQALEEDEVILEFQLLNTELITFIVTRKDFNIIYHHIDNLMVVNIQKLRKTLESNPLQSDWDSTFRIFTGSSYYLYDQLIRPVHDKIRNKRLIIIPHNELTQIPFETLITEEPKLNQPSDFKKLNYLIKEFTIVYAYSANLLLDNSTGRKYGSGTAVFLPDYSSYKGTDYQSLLPVLKGAASEAEMIKKLSHGKLFKGLLANETNFKMKANRYRVLHIASHTLLDDNNPALSCLVMTAPPDTSEDGFLYSYELMQMNLNAQLVVLSGCNTGFGVLRYSEGLISIARSFFYTGVRTVAYTLWQLPDEAGAFIIENFYKLIKRRNKPEDALRESKLEFLSNTDAVKSHPFYWASYVIVGKSDQVSLVRSNYRLIIIVSVILAVSAILLIIRRFRT
jgi:CHAT domain-containing protein